MSYVLIFVVLTLVLIKNGKAEVIKKQKMSDEEINEDPNSEEAYEQAVEQLTRHHNQLLKAVAKCDPEDDLCPIDSIQTIADRIGRTLAALKERSVKLTDLRQFMVKVTVPKVSSRKPVVITIRIDQLPTSRPLEVNEYLVIQSPMGEEHTMPLIVTKSVCVNYTRKFIVPDRTQRTIDFMRTAFIDVSIWKFTLTPELGLGTGKKSIVATAKTQFLPLCCSKVNSLQLDFRTPDRQKTDYVFSMTTSTDVPLVREFETCIDEQLALIRE